MPATEQAEQGQAPSTRNRGAELRIRNLLRECKDYRSRIVELERQLSGSAKEAERQNRELAQLRAELQGQEARQKAMPERIAKVRDEGRKLFADFDAVVSAVPVDRQAFDAFLASANGPELMYAAGLGIRLIAQLRQLQQQAESDYQRVQHYRSLHQQHFAGENNGL